MNIVITGASRGIGFETAAILGENHRVIAISRDVAGLKKLSSGRRNIEILKCDITNEKNLSRLYEFSKRYFSSIDVLINNAGFLVNKPFEKISDSEMLSVFDTNYFGVFRLIKVLLPLIKKSKSGHIVNIGSMGGFQGSSKFSGLSVYSSAKAALACLSECLAVEFKKNNISVNCLALGSAQTEMLAKAFPGYKAPLSAKQMAEFIAYFSISGNKYFNGQIIPVSLATP